MRERKWGRRSWRGIIIIVIVIKMRMTRGYKRATRMG